MPCDYLFIVIIHVRTTSRDLSGFRNEALKGCPKLKPKKRSFYVSLRYCAITVVCSLRLKNRGNSFNEALGHVFTSKYCIKYL